MMPSRSKIDMAASAKKHGVASLALSKKLRKAGYPQKGLWKWSYFDEDYSEITNHRNDLMTIDCIAPTVAELGEKLPYRLRLEDDDYWFWQTFLKHGETEIRYSNSKHTKIAFEQIQEDTQADAYGETMAYLLEKGLIKL